MFPETALSLLFDVAIKATLLMVLVGLTIRLFAGRRPALRALLWSYAFIALLLLPVASLILPALRVPILPSNANPPMASAQPPDHATSIDAPQPPNLEITPPHRQNALPNISASPTRPTAVHPAWSFPPWQTMILSLYLLGVGICLTHFLIGWWRIRTLRRNVHPFGTPRRMAQLDRWCRHLGISDRIDIGFSDRITVPTVIGMFSPLVVVPPYVATGSSDADWDGILAHELAHVKRRDALWNHLGLLVTALYWFHPLIYWARRDLATAREYACDDWAVSVLGNAKKYATLLMEITARTDRRLSHALGLDMARTAHVLHRVNRLLSRAPDALPGIGRIASSIALLLMLSSAALLGSLSPTPSELPGTTDIFSEIKNSEEAAQWMRKQYFLYNHGEGRREGQKLVRRFPQNAQLRAWYLLNMTADPYRTEVVQHIVDDLPEGDPWNDFIWAFIHRETQKAAALKRSERALSRMSDYPDMLWMRAQVLWKAQGPAAAVSFIDQNLNRVPNPAELLAVKGNILAYQAMGPQGNITSPDTMHAAFAAFEQARRQQPDNVAAYYRQGFFFLSTQRLSEAHPFFKRAAELSPHAVRLHRLYWYTTLHLHTIPFEAKRAEIESDIPRFLEGQERDPAALAAIAFIRNSLHQPQKVREVNDRILRDAPASPEAESVMAYRLRALRDSLSAGNTTEKAAFLEKSWAFINHPDHKDKRLLADAYRDLFQVLRADPAPRPEDLLRAVQGMAEYEVLNPNTAFHDGAIVLAERTAYHREAEAVAHRGFDIAKSWAKQRQGNDTAAYQRTLAVLTANAHDALGWVYFNEGRLSDSETELSKARETDPTFWQALNHLAQLYTRKGEWNRAEALYIEGMETRTWQNPDDEKGLRQLYETRHGNPDGFSDYIASVKKRVEAHRKAQVLATRSDTLGFAPSFDLTCIDGAPLSLPALRGKVVVLNMDIRAGETDLRTLQKLSDHYALRNDVVVMQINQNYRIKTVAESLHCTFPIVEGNAYIRKARVTRFSTTWFLDRQGRIAFSTTGYRAPAPWLQAAVWRIDALLGTSTGVN